MIESFRSVSQTCNQKQFLLVLPVLLSRDSSELFSLFEFVHRRFKMARIFFSPLFIAVILFVVTESNESELKKKIKLFFFSNFAMEKIQLKQVNKSKNLTLFLRRIYSFLTLNPSASLKNDVSKTVAEKSQPCRTSRNGNGNSDGMEFHPSISLHVRTRAKRTTEWLNFDVAISKSLKSEFVPIQMHNELRELKDFLLKGLDPKEVHDFRSTTHNSGEYLYDLFEYLLHRNIVKDEHKKELLRKFLPFIMSADVEE